MTAPSRPTRRVLAVGLDALPPEVLDSWCDSGDLPNLAAMREEGRRGLIQSISDYLPGATWPTFANGSPPSVHGIYHFMQWDPDSMSFRRPGPDWLPYVPFWQEMSARGVPSVAFDVPFACPQPDTRAIELHGWGLHDELAPPFSNPPGLLAEVRRLVGESGIKPDVLGPRSNSSLGAELTTLQTSIQKRTRIIEHMAQRFDWQFFLAVFGETHRAGHWMWSDRAFGKAKEGLRRVAMSIDAEIPRLRALLGPDDTFVIFSLHGMRDMYDIDRFSEAIGDQLSPAGAGASRRLDPVRIANRVLPQGLRRRMSAALTTGFRDRLFGHYLSTGQDWQATKVLMNPPDGGLYARANRIGRESKGSVPDSEVEALLASVESDLRGIVDIDGKPVISDTFRSTSLFPSGARSPLLPDIIALAQGPVPDTIQLPGREPITVKWRGWRDGDHHGTGFFLIAGAGAADAPPGKVRGQDFAKLLCSYAGQSY